MYKPDNCPFTKTPCHEYCWCWDRKEAPGRCSAFEMFPEAVGHANEFYLACIKEILGEDTEDIQRLADQETQPSMP